MRSTSNTLHVLLLRHCAIQDTLPTIDLLLSQFGIPYVLVIDWRAIGVNCRPTRAFNSKETK